jgi:hypothetical protein
MASLIVVGTNSYVSEADASAYFATSLFSAEWDAAFTETREKALITATRRIDMQVFNGVKASLDQPLEFPRALGVHIRPNLVPLIDTEVPQAVIDATCEEALALLRVTKMDNRNYDLVRLGISSYELGDSSQQFNEKIMLRLLDGQELLSPVAKRLLKPYLAGAVEII